LVREDGARQWLRSESIGDVEVLLMQVGGG